jgi:hypothetical protein
MRLGGSIFRIGIKSILIAECRSERILFSLSFAHCSTHNGAVSD